MCGISGVLSFDAVSQYSLDKIDLMLKGMAYRGPDDKGIWSNQDCCLGMVRLSIVGLSNGRQPISNETGNLIMVCNGEIYNHLELKEELVAKGHRFCTSTDVEVIPHLYEEYGRDCWEKLGGMFACAIFNTETRSLTLARDRFGEKPLYFARLGKNYVFNSEITPLLNYWIDQPELDNGVLEETLSYSYPQNERQTHISQIQRVLPGESITISPTNESRRRFWTPNRNSSFSGSRANAVEQLQIRLKAAVKSMIPTEVPVAVMLSGGIDSSSVAAIAAMEKPGLVGICVGYDSDSFENEIPAARRFADETGIDFAEIRLGQSEFDQAFHEFVDFIDEPIGDPAAIMQWALYKKARSFGFKVLLNGLGGDELFFGYPAHNAQGVALASLAKLKSYLPLSRSSIPRITYDILRSGRQFWNALRRIHPSRYDRSLSKSSRKVESHPLALDLPLRYATQSEAYVEGLYHYFRRIYLPLNGLLQADRLAMAHSIEVRCPFLDKELSEFALSLPLEVAFDPLNPKQILKDAMRGIVPDFILDAPKRGFTPDNILFSNLLDRLSSQAGIDPSFTALVQRRLIGSQINKRVGQDSVADTLPTF